MIEANRYRLGLFVVTGVSLFLLVLFFLGMSELFKKKVRLVTFFNESVQGLDIGSPVKYKGVPIGKVSKITIRVEDKLIRVEMEVMLAAFTADKRTDKNFENHFHKFLDEEIVNGLRCQLVYTGITGMKYVEIDYFDPSKLPPVEVTHGQSKSTHYVPSAPSVFKDILKLINESLEKIAKMKFDEISEQLVATIKKANELIADPKIEAIVARLENMSRSLDETMGSINKTMTEDKVREIVTDFSDSMKSFNKLAAEAQAQLEKANIPESSSKFREAMDAVAQAKHSVTNTLLRLDQTLDSLTELVNSLDEDPSSVLKGKSKPQMKKK